METYILRFADLIAANFGVTLIEFAAFVWLAKQAVILAYHAFKLLRRKTKS